MRVTELVEGRLPLRGALYSPGPTTGSAVIVVGGSEGGDYQSRLLAREFACDGVTALGLAYFGAYDLPPSLARIPLDYFAIAADWLAAQPGVEPDAVAILGMSRGSEAALLTACHFPKVIRGVIAAVPGNVALAGWPDGGPCWMVHDDPVPYADTFGPDCADPSAVIPLEQAEAAILAIGAGRDQVWPSAPMARALIDRLDRARYPFPHRLLTYDEASHRLGFVAPLDRVDPTLVRPNDPDTTARAHAWPEVLDFVNDVRDRAALVVSTSA